MADYDYRKAEELEQKYDSGLQTRNTGPYLKLFGLWFSVVFALYHYITAGFGTPVDFWHMGIHMSGVILLIYIGFPLLSRFKGSPVLPNTFYRFGNVPLYDWIAIFLGILTSSALPGMVCRFRCSESTLKIRCCAKETQRGLISSWVRS